MVQRSSIPRESSSPVPYSEHPPESTNPLSSANVDEVSKTLLMFCTSTSPTTTPNTPPPLNDETKLPSPPAVAHDEHDASQTGHLLTLMNMIKANVGAGILAMPLAFSHSGLSMGVVYTFMLGLICVDCMHMVVRASNYYKHKLQRSLLSYPDVAFLAFHNSPLKCLSSAARLSVVIFLTLTQLGFCCVYIVFIGRTSENVIRHYYGSEEGGWFKNIRWLELMSAPAFLLLVTVRQMDRLATIMMLGNIITLAVLICVWQEAAQHLLPFTSLPQIGTATNFARFLSTALYAFTGIGCVLPVENKMQRPETFGGTFGVLNQAMLIVAIIYAITGFLGYWGYGGEIRGSITYNLPARPIYVAVKIAMAVSVFISYGIQFYVPIKMIALTIRERWQRKSNSRKLAGEYGARFGLMLLTLALALFIPYLGMFIDLIGAFCCAYLALILPPLIDLTYRYQLDGNNVSRRYGKMYWIFIKDVALLLFGVAGWSVGTYLAVHDIVVQIIKDVTPLTFEVMVNQTLPH